MIRSVLDANVFIAALISPSGPAGRIIDAWVKEKRVHVIASHAIFQEVSRAAFYPQVRKYVYLSDIEIRRWIASAEVLADIVTPTAHVSAVHDDPDDNKYIEAALEGRADVLVSGDKHLLSLGKFQEIQIINPTDFLSWL